jgi:hypothetical protein
MISKSIGCPVDVISVKLLIVVEAPPAYELALSPMTKADVLKLVECFHCATR